MSIRITEDEVKKIISTSLDVGIFINVASRFVDEVLGGSSLSADRLGDIELYLASHLTALSEEGGGVTMQRVGSTTIQYSQLQGSQLSLTRFGQMALLLDTTGLLKKNEKEKAGLSVIGAATADTPAG